MTLLKNLKSLKSLYLTFEYDFFEEPELIFTEEIIFEQLQLLDEFIEPIPFIREEEIFLPIEDLMIEEFVFQETFIEEMEEWFEEEAIIEEELDVRRGVGGRTY